MSNFDYGNHTFCCECAEFERRRHNGWADPYADAPKRLVAANDNEVVVCRECTCCKLELLLTDFGLAKKGLFGRSTVCKSCRSKTRGDRSEENARKREAVAAAGRAKTHRKRLLCDRWWRKYLAEKRAIARRIESYLSKFDRPWTMPGLTEAEKYRLRYANDNEFMLRERTRRRLRRKGFGFDALWRMRQALNGDVGDVGTATIEAALGYSMADLRGHLEALFVDGMSWEAFKRGEIHIDHKTPLSRFDLSDPAQAVVAWSLTNLQPLWATDNMAKGAKTDEEWRAAA
ncbi:hypothetical protein [Shinella zoogloeoides]|uniref:hypothetical protein n=1 Tax=Shinella zoogloeoides TaxID=352475 RepID=UPI0028A6B765|nr:hypothetical protein [Shinella zoogloeoides]